MPEENAHANDNSSLTTFNNGVQKAMSRHIVTWHLVNNTLSNHREWSRDTGEERVGVRESSTLLLRHWAGHDTLHTVLACVWLHHSLPCSSHPLPLLTEM